MTRQTVKPQKNLQETMPPREWELLQMLGYKRPAWSKTEAEFSERYIEPLGAERDKVGNWWLTVGEGSPILWSCHTDTVHREAGFQKIYITEQGSAFTEKSNCLGADDTTGVWLMRQLALAGIPGTYVFHVGEEIGGVGSDWIADNMADRLKMHSFAVAFDRKGDNEIITHQMVGRTASDTFALSLAECLQPLDYAPSDGGAFTDTAHYSRIISECTNIGVGYERQHQSQEYQDVRHATALLDRLLVADFSKLVYARDPDVVEKKTYSFGKYKGPNSYGGLYDSGDGEYVEWWSNAATHANDSTEGLERFLAGGVKQIASEAGEKAEIEKPEYPPRDYRMDIADYCREYSEDMADILLELGVTVGDVEDWLWNRYGVDR